MLCLGIETSCDETAFALVEDGWLTASVLSSQTNIHALFGGVVPELAAREHARLIGSLYDRLPLEGRIPDAVAFARGPGLLGSLLVGAAFAKALALAWGAKLIGVHHLHAHLLAVGLERELLFPSVGLLVSGGHTCMYRMESPRRFILLGKTLDDAAGEAFDKIGKCLGFPYPAGCIMDELGRTGMIHPHLFRTPYTDNATLDFSFSGLKTAAALYISRHPELRHADLEDTRQRSAVADFCASLGHIIAETLKIKCLRAVEQERKKGLRAVILAGGVAANSSVRAALAECAAQTGLPLLLPSPALCTDNGGMIAYAGWLLAGQLGLVHDLDISSVPRGTPVPDDCCPADAEKITGPLNKNPSG
jgi:N6-L-threonylcarbamoyladenine synthase